MQVIRRYPTLWGDVWVLQMKCNRCHLCQNASVLQWNLQLYRLNGFWKWLGGLAKTPQNWHEPLKNYKRTWTDWTRRSLTIKYLVGDCGSTSSHQILWGSVPRHAKCHQSETPEHNHLLFDQKVEMLPESLQENYLINASERERQGKSRPIMSKVCTNFHYHIRYENCIFKSFLTSKLIFTVSGL